MSEVVVGIITRLNNDQEEVLLVKSKKDFEKFAGLYYPPGGHLKSGESKEVALKRELCEELDLEVEPLFEIAETPGDIEGQVTYWWKCTIKKGTPKTNQNELADSGFFPLNSVLELDLWPATRKFFEEYIKQKPATS